MSKLSDKINDGEYCCICSKALKKPEKPSQQKCTECLTISIDMAESMAWERNDEEPSLKSLDMENEF